MTLTPLRARPADVDGADALIREARRFQRRRWWGRGALALAVLVVATVVFSATRVGAPATPRPQPFRPAPPPTAHVVGGPSLGPATSSLLTGPTSVAVDADDNAFFTDGNRVYEVDHATNQLLVAAGTGVNGFSGDGGPGPDAELNFPTGIALAPDGDVYFEDGNDRIRKISAATGTISTVAGRGFPGYGGNGGPAARAILDLQNPAGGSGDIDGQIAVGPNGDLYIADEANNEVRKVSAATGVITDVAGNGRDGSTGDGGPALKAELCDPVGITVDRSSDLFITTACDSIREVSGRTGLISTIFRVRQVPALAREGTVHDPVSLGIGADGNLLVAGSTDRRVLEIALRTHAVTMVAGTGSETFPEAGATAGDGGPASAATFGSVDGVTVDGHGNIYVADFFNNAIRQIDARTGVITLVAGQIPMSPGAGHCC